MDRRMLYVLGLIIVALLGYSVWALTRESDPNNQTPPTATVPITNNPEPTLPTTVYDRASEDDIVVTSVTKKNDTTIHIEGRARGPWYFEASFPIEVKDNNGARLALAPMMTSAEWMTTEFVPFSGDITLSRAYSGVTTIVLQKDNPSGDAVRDASLTYTVDLK